MPQTEPSLSRVGAITRERDPDRFLTALFAPEPRREALFALYAFNYEVAKTREVVTEPMLGRMRLQWWRDSIAAIYDGTPVRRQEVVEPLAAAIVAHGLSRGHFERLIDAREADLDGEPPASLAALEAYAAATSGALVLLALEALGVRDAATEAAGRAIGTGYALAGLLRAIPFHARGKRLYLPGDLVAASGLDVSRTLFEMKSSTELASLVATIAAAAQKHLAAGRRARKTLPRAALPALLPAVLARSWLRGLARARFDPFDPRLARPDGMRAARLAAAAWLGRY